MSNYLLYHKLCRSQEIYLWIYILFRWQALKEGREPDLSDYKQFKIQCDNVGYQMLQKMGWKEGEGLGSEGQGIKDPVNK